MNDLSAVKIDLVDLTVIISNTLDNAIEACEKLPVQDRQIYIQVVLDDNELFYAVRNRSLPVDVSSDRLPVTTKENRLFMDMAYRMCKPLWQNIILSMLWIMQMDGLNLQQICRILSFHDRKL